MIGAIHLIKHPEGADTQLTAGVSVPRDQDVNDSAVMSREAQSPSMGNFLKRAKSRSSVRKRETPASRHTATI